MLRAALFWATAKDSMKRCKKLHPDPEGVAYDCSIYMHFRSPGKITQGVILSSVAFILGLTSLHVHNLYEVFNRGCLLSFKEMNCLK